MGKGELAHMTFENTAAAAAPGVADTASGQEQVQAREPEGGRVDAPAVPVDGPAVRVDAGAVHVDATPAQLGITMDPAYTDAALKLLTDADPEARRILSEQLRIAAERMIADMVPQVVDIGIQRLDVRPGDTVVVQIDHPLRWDARARAQDHMKAILPPGVSALLLERGANIKIIGGQAVPAATENG